MLDLLKPLNFTYDIFSHFQTKYNHRAELQSTRGQCEYHLHLKRGPMLLSRAAISKREQGVTGSINVHCSQSKFLNIETLSKYKSYHLDKTRGSCSWILSTMKAPALEPCVHPCVWGEHPSFTQKGPTPVRNSLSCTYYLYISLQDLWS